MISQQILSSAGKCYMHWHTVLSQVKSVFIFTRLKLCIINILVPFYRTLQHLFQHHRSHVILNQYQTNNHPVMNMLVYFATKKFFDGILELRMLLLQLLSSIIWSLGCSAQQAANEEWGSEIEDSGLSISVAQLTSLKPSAGQVSSKCEIVNAGTQATFALNIIIFTYSKTLVSDHTTWSR